MLVLLGVFAQPIPAAAQYGVLEWSRGALPMCYSVVARTGRCPLSCPTPQVCHDVNLTESVCAPPRALFCIDADIPGSECPYGRSRRVGVGSTSIELCIPDSARICADVGDLASCFTTPSRTGASEFPVDYMYGDCDGDLIPNGVDTAPCEVPPDVTFITPTGTCDFAVPCGVDAMCPEGSECTTADDVDPHTFCFPLDRGVVFCCGGFVGIPCPDGDTCEASATDGNGFCPDPEYCPDMPFTERVACLTYEGELFPVEPDNGDCDGDGIRNAEDERPCEFDETDAGVPTVDAGVPQDDAGGGGMDGSIPHDVVPDFRGGSGCACRAAPSAGGSIAWLVGLLGLIVIRRRR